VTLGGLLTPGGRSVAKGVAKGTSTAVKEVTGSWRERRRKERELRAGADRDRVMEQMYQHNPEFRAAVDNASSAPKRWWSR
jgi:hypothetical protein